MGLSLRGIVLVVLISVNHLSSVSSYPASDEDDTTTPESIEEIFRAYDNEYHNTKTEVSSEGVQKDSTNITPNDVLRRLEKVLQNDSPQSVPFENPSLPFENDILRKQSSDLAFGRRRTARKVKQTRLFPSSDEIESYMIDLDQNVFLNKEAFQFTDTSKEEIENPPKPFTIKPIPVRLDTRKTTVVKKVTSKPTKAVYTRTTATKAHDHKKEFNFEDILAAQIFNKTSPNKLSTPVLTVATEDFEEEIPFRPNPLAAPPKQSEAETPDFQGTSANQYMNHRRGSPFRTKRESNFDWFVNKMALFFDFYGETEAEEIEGRELSNHNKRQVSVQDEDIQNNLENNLTDILAENFDNLRAAKEREREDEEEEAPPVSDPVIETFQKIVDPETIHEFAKDVPPILEKIEELEEEEKISNPIKINVVETDQTKQMRIGDVVEVDSEEIVDEGRGLTMEKEIEEAFEEAAKEPEAKVTPIQSTTDSISLRLDFDEGIVIDPVDVSAPPDGDIIEFAKEIEFTTEKAEEVTSSFEILDEIIKVNDEIKENITKVIESTSTFQILNEIEKINEEVKNNLTRIILQNEPTMSLSPIPSLNIYDNEFDFDDNSTYEVERNVPKSKLSTSKISETKIVEENPLKSEIKPVIIEDVPRSEIEHDTKVTQEISNEINANSNLTEIKPEVIEDLLRSENKIAVVEPEIIENLPRSEIVNPIVEETPITTEIKPEIIEDLSRSQIENDVKFTEDVNEEIPNEIHENSNPIKTEDIVEIGQKLDKIIEEIKLKDPEVTSIKIQDDPETVDQFQTSFTTSETIRSEDLSFSKSSDVTPTEEEAEGLNPSIKQTSENLSQISEENSSLLKTAAEKDVIEIETRTETPFSSFENYIDNDTTEIIMDNVEVPEHDIIANDPIEQLSSQTSVISSSEIEIEKELKTSDPETDPETDNRSRDAINNESRPQVLIQNSDYIDNDTTEIVQPIVVPELDFISNDSSEKIYTRTLENSASEIIVNVDLKKSNLEINTEFENRRSDALNNESKPQIVVPNPEEDILPKSVTDVQFNSNLEDILRSTEIDHETHNLEEKINVSNDLIEIAIEKDLKNSNSEINPETDNRRRDAFNNESKPQIVIPNSDEDILPKTVSEVEFDGSSADILRSTEDVNSKPLENTASEIAIEDLKSSNLEIDPEIENHRSDALNNESKPQIVIPNSEQDILPKSVSELEFKSSSTDILRSTEIDLNEPHNNIKSIENSASDIVKISNLEDDAEFKNRRSDTLNNESKPQIVIPNSGEDILPKTVSEVEFDGSSADILRSTEVDHVIENTNTKTLENAASVNAIEDLKSSNLEIEQEFENRRSDAVNNESKPQIVVPNSEEDILPKSTFENEFNLHLQNSFRTSDLEIDQNESHNLKETPEITTELLIDEDLRKISEVISTEGLSIEKLQVPTGIEEFQDITRKLNKIGDLIEEKAEQMHNKGDVSMTPEVDQENTPKKESVSNFVSINSPKLVEDPIDEEVVDETRHNFNIDVIPNKIAEEILEDKHPEIRFDEKLEFTTEIPELETETPYESPKINQDELRAEEIQEILQPIDEFPKEVEEIIEKSTPIVYKLGESNVPKTPEFSLLIPEEQEFVEEEAYQTTVQEGIYETTIIPDLRSLIEIGSSENKIISPEFEESVLVSHDSDPKVLSSPAEEDPSVPLITENVEGVRLSSIINDVLEEENLGYGLNFRDDTLTTVFPIDWLKEKETAPKSGFHSANTVESDEVTTVEVEEISTEQSYEEISTEKVSTEEFFETEEITTENFVKTTSADSSEEDDSGETSEEKLERKLAKKLAKEAKKKEKNKINSSEEDNLDSASSNRIVLISTFSENEISREVEEKMTKKEMINLFSEAVQEIESEKSFSDFSKISSVSDLIEDGEKKTSYGHVVIKKDGAEVVDLSESFSSITETSNIPEFLENSEKEITNDIGNTILDLLPPFRDEILVESSSESQDFLDRLETNNEIISSKNTRHLDRVGAFGEKFLTKDSPLNVDEIQPRNNDIPESASEMQIDGSSHHRAMVFVGCGLFLVAGVVLIASIFLVVKKTRRYGSMDFTMQI